MGDVGEEILRAKARRTDEGGDKHAMIRGL